MNPEFPLSHLTARPSRWFAVLAITCALFAVSLDAAAIPKAAEDETASVTFGADAPRPKIAKATQTVKKTPTKASTTSHGHRPHSVAKPRRK